MNGASVRSDQIWRKQPRGSFRRFLVTCYHNGARGNVVEDRQFGLRLPVPTLRKSRPAGLQSMRLEVVNLYF
jgi:hypothetical protein